MGMGWNEQIIREFRENNGRVGGMFEGVPLVLITTAGARSGRPHTTPVVCLRDSGRVVVFGSNMGKDRHPDWYRNILGTAQVTMETGTAEGRVKSFSTRAVVLEGEERDRLWEQQCSLDPAFRAYQEKTARQIPVIALHPLDLSADPSRNRLIGEQLLAHHRDLRAELARLRAAIDPAKATPEAEPEAAAQLRAHCLAFCFGLQLHHTREDGAFTEFERVYPHLAPAITRLRAEHAVVEQGLKEFKALLSGAGAAGESDSVRAELERVVAGLEQHFAYEEEQLLPALRGDVG
ncbi:deazaflavin-dependent oxidoreductase (nitroreductase family) [Streptomyces sp. 846.5]|nr:nitroreductase/quinone reductase family protein [Streptomyces sp. 846.5]TDU02647.1 deazaflavin-dependent oxidoreductase (nitroreductase family) [Streptomyces sp. 846.5]